MTVIQLKYVIVSAITLLSPLLLAAKEVDRKPNEVKESAVEIWCSQNYMTSKKTVFSKVLSKKEHHFETEIAFSEKWIVNVEYGAGQLTYRTKIDGVGSEIVVRGDAARSALTISSDNEFGLSCSLSKKFLID